MNWRNYGRLPRVIAGLGMLGAALLLLWQAGVLFGPRSASVTGEGGETVRLDPPAFFADDVDNTPAGIDVGAHEGQAAPDFEFSAFDGERVRLSDFRGQPVFLNFWASWCAPCRAEMPAMEVILREHQSDGLVVLGVNNGERIESARRFLERLDVELTAYAYDPGAEIAERYSVVGMPTSFFIDAEGVITDVYATALSEDIMREAVAKAIAGHEAQD